MADLIPKNLITKRREASKAYHEAKIDRESCVEILAVRIGREAPDKMIIAIAKRLAQRHASMIKARRAYHRAARACGKAVRQQREAKSRRRS